MKNKISSLMDGELDGIEIADTIAQIKKTENLRDDWAIYHLIGDTLRQSALAPIDIASQVSKKLAAEPTVLSPHFPTQNKGKVLAFSVAASMVTAVVAVVWMSAQTMNQPVEPMQQASVQSEPSIIPASVPPTLAQTESMTDKSLLKTAVQAESAVMPLPILAPSQINDYLLLHGEFSPHTAMQGVTPYIHTVADSDKRTTR